MELDDDKLGFVASMDKNPQKARVLLRLALLQAAPRGRRAADLQRVLISSGRDSREIEMKLRYRKAGVIAGALILAASGALAQTPERLSDNEVKALDREVDTGRDKFEGNLDGDFKGATLRGPNGETKVAVALQDYQDSTKNLQHRFAPDYNASAEAATVLKQSTKIDQFMKGPSSPTKGRNEWDRQVVNLKRLARSTARRFPCRMGLWSVG